MWSYVIFDQFFVLIKKIYNIGKFGWKDKIKDLKFYLT